MPSARSRTRATTIPSLFMITGSASTHSTPPRDRTSPDRSAVRAPVILVIDDEPQIRRALSDALAGLPARVLEARTARQGVEVSAVEHPDLVVLDLGLPDGTGLDVCAEIRRWSGAPIVVLSA